MHHVRQDEAQYPLLEYFHSPDDQTALPLALPVFLETLTLVRAVLDPEPYPDLVSGPGTLAAYDTAVAYEHERLAAVGVPPEETEELRQSRARRYALARAELAEEGVSLREDDDARQRYLRMRSEWDCANAGVRRHFGYDR